MELRELVLALMCFVNSAILIVCIAKLSTLTHRNVHKMNPCALLCLASVCFSMKVCTFL